MAGPDFSWLLSCDCTEPEVTFCFPADENGYRVLETPVYEPTSVLHQNLDPSLYDPSYPVFDMPPPTPVPMQPDDDPPPEMKRGDPELNFEKPRDLPPKTSDEPPAIKMDPPPVPSTEGVVASRAPDGDLPKMGKPSKKPSETKRPLIPYRAKRLKSLAPSSKELEKTFKRPLPKLGKPAGAETKTPNEHLPYLKATESRPTSKERKLRFLPRQIRNHDVMLRKDWKNYKIPKIKHYECDVLILHPDPEEYRELLGYDYCY